MELIIQVSTFTLFDELCVTKWNYDKFLEYEISATKAHHHVKNWNKTDGSEITTNNEMFS